MGSFNTQSRDKNQIRANFGYKRIGPNSNPYSRQEIKNTHATKTWILSHVYSQPLDWPSRRETRTLLWLATTEVRRNGTPHTFIQGTESVIYSDLSSVLVIESRQGTDWEWTQAHSPVMNEWVLIATCKQLVWSTRIGRNMSSESRVSR
jgi:uncharacterized protein with NAD-binding domain and iron-sulfur cluster